MNYPRTYRMSFRLPLKHYFRVEKCRSGDQLARDFGAFPPFPLNCKETKSVVTIVHAAGAGGLLNCFQITSKLFAIDRSGPRPVIRSSLEYELARHGAMELVDLINDVVRRCPQVSAIWPLGP